MGETARAEIRAPSLCERCGAPCELESDGEKPRLRCAACNHIFDVAVVQASIGKWTVVDPDGVVRRFSSWQELIASLPNASSFGAGESPTARLTRSSSAAALLDVTPPPPSVAPGPPRLSLVPGDDPPPLPRAARPRTEPPPPPAPAPKAEAEAIEDLPDDEVVPASDGARMPPVRSIPPPLPPVARVASIPPPLPPVARAASIPPPIPASAIVRSADPSEPPPPPPLSPPPPPPKGGTLRTLPPPPRRDHPAPPPPTIKVIESNPPPPVEASADAPATTAKGSSDAEPAAKAAAVTSTKGKDADESSTPPKPRVSSAPPSTRSSAPARARASAAASSASKSKTDGHAGSKPPARAAEPAEPSANRWFLPFVAIGILALGLAYVRRSSPAPDETPVTPATSGAAGLNDPHPPSSAATNATTDRGPAANGGGATSTASTTASASTQSPSADPSPSTSAPSSAVLEAKPPTTGSVAERAPVGDSQLSLPDVLERAASARRSGDAPHAKALLERALVLSPGNAEAYGLLGDLARSQGDSAGAKDAYTKALGTSPSYYPALLGLADTEWDLGERDAAQRHYVTINGLGRAAPERVKERALGGGASSSSVQSTAPAPTPSTAAPTPIAATSTAAPASTTAAPAETDGKSESAPTTKP